MSYSVSSETLAVLQNFHERVKNRLLRLREQEEWRRYCVQHNIAEKPQCTQRAHNATAGATAAQRRVSAHATPRRIPIRKVSGSSPAYCLRSLSDQLAVYYRELERLQSDSQGCVARLKSPETSTGRANDVLTVCAQTQTVTTAVAPERNSESHRRDRFRVMLNPEPNERFCVVRKERVFRPLEGIRRRVTWAGAVVEGKKEVRRASCDANGNEHDAEVTVIKSKIDDHTDGNGDDAKVIFKRTTSLDVPESLIAELDLYRKQVERRTTWKSRLPLDETRDPWSVVDSITSDILGDVLNSVLEEVERVFSGIIDELLDQELVDQVNG
ncbi:hypothetical protein HPB51_008275 [Rhipicephalus microplus]|uniref:Uncharacterized protein n=1 Tax=Rhipicephalus microplus TaxID=6941 RepID=A0A9J6EZ08_RHIMP|nr:hypothetical protein HPB51_008275 [Rhipicephalus microplus]